MKIQVLVQGDPDTKPFTQTFSYETSDESIFLESALQIKERLSNNMRLNINETLELFIAYIRTAVNECIDINQIQDHISKLLQPHQVMIGVPESLREMTFTIITPDNDSDSIISVTNPIRINEYFMYQHQQRDMDRRAK